MVNDRKRLEAISEIFESEKSYVHEMRLWSTKFRKFLLNCASISPQRKYSLNRVIFLNIEDITILHESMLLEMANTNEKFRVDANIKQNDIYARIDLENHLNIYLPLDYTEIILKYMKRFEIYQFYIEKLPKIEFVIDKEIALNKEFSIDLKNFLIETGYGIIGFKHFIFRPSQKLSRYPLLLNAINKSTEDLQTKQRIKVCNDFLIKKTKEFDKILGYVKNAFQLYGLHYSLSFMEHVKNRLSPGLFMRDSKLNQISSDVFVLSKYRMEPRPYRIYLTNNMLIVVDVVARVFGEKLNIVDDPVPLVKYILLDVFHDPTNIVYFQERHKFLLKEIDGDDALYLYFKTEAQCNELRAAIKNVIQTIKEKFLDSIELCEIGKIGNNIQQILITDPYYTGSSFSDEEETINKALITTCIKNRMKKKEMLHFNKEKTLNSSIKTNQDVCSNTKNTENKSVNPNENSFFAEKRYVSNVEECKSTCVSECDSNESISDELNIKYEERTVGFLNINEEYHKRTSVESLNISINSLDIGEDPKEERKTIDANKTETIGQLIEDYDDKHSQENEVIRKSREIFIDSCCEDGNEENLVFFINPSGVYMQQKNTIRRVHKNPIQRILYIAQFKIICFIENDACYWSPIPSTYFEKNLICYRADNIWSGNTLNTPVLAVKLISNISTSYLHIFKISESNFSLMMQLFIGASISKISFFSSKLIVSCKEYEVINMYNLETYELLNINDMYLGLILTNQYPTNAMDLFKIQKGRYLVCNEKIGFYINQYGACPSDSALFVWYNKPTEFRVFSDYIIVLSLEGVVIYNASNGVILKWIGKKKLKFVKCCAGIWVHNEDTLFEIKFPLGMMIK